MFSPDHAPIYIQHLTNHLFYAAEDQLVIWHNINSSALRQRFLKDMFEQWRAVLISFDEGLIKGDAVFGAAVWRGLFASREDADFEKIAQIVAYMRRELKMLEAMTDEEVVHEEWSFERNPSMEAEAVSRQSPSMNLASEPVVAPPAVEAPAPAHA
jgi:cytochrome b pre-mRNA-processing protein 3